MKIAIHHEKDSFSERWIAYCENREIPYKLVRAYDNDIIEQVMDCDIFLWNHHHGNYRDALFAKQLLYSLQAAGKKVFPDFNTTWHFDDKLGQKYLLVAIGAPIVPSHAFYSEKDANQWIKKSEFPKVFKLSRGAGSMNVRLVKNRKQAVTLAKKAFGKGFRQYNKLGWLKERYRVYREGNKSLFWYLKGFAYMVLTSEFDKMHPREKGYIYFQDYIPGNEFDIRIIVIGDKAFGLKRMTRKNDFRASGSGHIRYEREDLDERCAGIAFGINDQLKTQCIAFDFIFDSQNTPLIIEVSYAFSVTAYDKCPGYWDRALQWHEGKFNPQEWMLENLLQQV